MEGYKDHRELGKYVSTKEWNKLSVISSKEMEIQEFPTKTFKKMF